MDKYGTSCDHRNPKSVQEAILRALQEGDYEAVIWLYRAHLRLLNRSHAAIALKVSRQYIYRMLEPGNTPSLRTFVSFMKSLREQAGV